MFRATLRARRIKIPNSLGACVQHVIMHNLRRLEGRRRIVRQPVEAAPISHIDLVFWWCRAVDGVRHETSLRNRQAGQLAFVPGRKFVCNGQRDKRGARHVTFSGYQIDLLQQSVEQVDLNANGLRGNPCKIDVDKHPDSFPVVHLVRLQL